MRHRDSNPRDRGETSHGRRGHRRHGRHHDKGGDGLHAGRLLAQGELGLIMLALIAEQPRHGYEIIKSIEDKTDGWYSPSPGIVYPTLTFLEETGHVTAQADGARKLHTITSEGRAHLQENRPVADMALNRLTAAAAQFGRMSRIAGEEENGRRKSALTPLVRAALDNLRMVATERLDRDAETEAKVVEVLARAATELRRI